MTDGLTCTTDVAVMLKKAMGAQNPNTEFYKFRKTTDYKGEYLVVNYLPFAYGGKALNDYNRLNVNIHVPELVSGNVPTKRLTELKTQVEELIPYECAEETRKTLILNGVSYTIDNVSQPMDDDDGTWFLNIVLKVVFNN